MSLSSLDALERVVLASHVFVSRKHKLAFCVPPKNACTAFKMMLARAEGLAFEETMDLHRRGFLPTADSLRMSAGELEALLNDPAFTLVTVVRDPYARLVSGYLNKFGPRGDKGREMYGCAAYYPTQASAYRVGRAKPCPPSFEDLLDVLGVARPASWNEHFAPQTTLCRPDLVSYDYTFEARSVQRHMPALLRRLGLDPAWFPPANAGGHATDAERNVCSFLNARTLPRVKDLYALDLKSPLFRAYRPPPECARVRPKGPPYVDDDAEDSEPASESESESEDGRATA